MHKKIVLPLFFALVLISLSAVPSFGESGEISIIIDGKKVQYNDSTGYPFIDSANRTQVPFRKTLEDYGCTVTWDGKLKSAGADKDNTDVKIVIGEKSVAKNAGKVDMDTAALVKENRTYLPIAMILQAFDAKVTWDAAAKTVTIQSPAYLTSKNKHLYYKKFPDILAINDNNNAILELVIESGSNDQYIYQYKVIDSGPQSAEALASESCSSYASALSNAGQYPADYLGKGTAPDLAYSFSSADKRYHIEFYSKGSDIYVIITDNHAAGASAPVQQANGDSTSFYDEFDGVPDFGQLTGVDCTDKTNKTYVYNMSDVGADAMKAYFRLMSDAGFIYAEDVKNSGGIECPLFVNPELGLQVVLSLERDGGNDMLVIIIDPYTN